MLQGFITSQVVRDIFHQQYGDHFFNADTP